MASKRDANGTRYQAGRVELSCGHYVGEQNPIVGEARSCRRCGTVVTVLRVVTEGVRTR